MWIHIDRQKRVRPELTVGFLKEISRETRPIIMSWLVLQVSQFGKTQSVPTLKHTQNSNAVGPVFLSPTGRRLSFTEMGQLIS
jgi:hypothetical protein